MATFEEKLLAASRRNDSLLCVGLDPDPDLMPAGVDVATFNRAIIDATKDLVCAYKPNLGFYEAQGIDGLRSLEETLAAIPDDVPVIGDAKRGDIGSTDRFYARAMFEAWGFDAVTVNPYLGTDSIEPFTDYVDRGVLILCRTSASGSADLQSLIVDSPHGRVPLYEAVALKALDWNRNGNVGLVVGATAPDELEKVRGLCPDMTILVPGVGAQGADLTEAVTLGADAGGERVIVNSSRGVTYASRGPDFADAARRAALELRDRMRLALPERAG
jgi:orotidine-5'-phosphate decarboxylase